MSQNHRYYKLRNQIQGTVLGGAIGDALGYPVEFYSEAELRHVFGTRGIQNYKKDGKTNKALISDDTQMTLFTISGILGYDFESKHYPRKKVRSFPEHMTLSYLLWLKTQTEDCPVEFRLSPDFLDLDLNVGMYHQRNPGKTCLSTLKIRKEQKKQNRLPRHNFEKHPVNNSMGNGGLMRIAPIALYHAKQPSSAKTLAEETRQAVLITHGSPAAWIPAVYYNLLLWWIIRQEKYPVASSDLKQGMKIIEEILQTLYPKYQKNLVFLFNQVHHAASLAAQSGSSDIKNIHLLGKGDIAPETLAIALYCALKYTNDFDSGIIAAVNHEGDSDTTGAVTGAMLGAINGEPDIEYDRWIQPLDLRMTLYNAAEELYKII